MKKVDIQVLCGLIEKELTVHSMVRKEELTKKLKQDERNVVKALDVLNKQGKVSLAQHTVCPDWVFYTNKKGKQAKRKCWHPDVYLSNICGVGVNG